MPNVVTTENTKYLSKRLLLSLCVTTPFFGFFVGWVFSFSAGWAFSPVAIITHKLALVATLLFVIYFIFIPWALKSATWLYLQNAYLMLAAMLLDWYASTQMLMQTLPKPWAYTIISLIFIFFIFFFSLKQTRVHFDYINKQLKKLNTYDLDQKKFYLSRGVPGSLKIFTPKDHPRFKRSILHSILQKIGNILLGLIFFLPYLPSALRGVHHGDTLLQIYIGVFLAGAAWFCGYATHICFVLAWVYHRIAKKIDVPLVPQYRILN